jgi:hypothetical protein
MLHAAERDEQGGLRAFSLTWSKAGNRLHNDWDNTILGQIEANGDALTASVNSNGRAARLRRETRAARQARGVRARRHRIGRHLVEGDD